MDYKSHLRVPNFPEGFAKNKKECVSEKVTFGSEGGVHDRLDTYKVQPCNVGYVFIRVNSTGICVCDKPLELTRAAEG